MLKAEKQLKTPLMEILSPFPVADPSINAVDFSNCVELARQHGVEMLFYSRLKKHYAGSNPCISDYLKKNENAYLMAVARSMRQEAVEKNVVAMLGKEGIPACIFKGNEIARSLYNDPNCRSSSDIDVLVRRKDLFAADRILRSAHYHYDTEIPITYFISYNVNHVSYSDPGNTNIIELHWSFGIPAFFKLSSEETWEGIFIDGDGHATLLPEMMVIMLLIHHHAHAFSELRIVVDLLWAFQKYEQSIHWPEFSVRLKRLGLAKTALISLSQLNALWPEKIPRLQSIDALQRSLSDMNSMVSQYLTAYFRMELGGSPRYLSFKDLFFSRLAIDSLNIILLSYVKPLFPPPEVIKEFYGTDSKLTLPLNYLRFISFRVKYWIR